MTAVSLRRDTSKRQRSPSKSLIHFCRLRVSVWRPPGYCCSRDTPGAEALEGRTRLGKDGGTAVSLAVSPAGPRQGSTAGQHRHAGPRRQHVLPTAELIAINSPSQTHRSSKSASVQHHCTHLGLLPLRASWGKGDDAAALPQNQVGWEDTGACVKGSLFCHLRAAQ